MQSVVRGLMSALMAVVMIFAFALPAHADITIYTSRKPANTDAVVAAFEKKTGVKVQVVRGEEPQLLARMGIERENAQADLFWTQDAASLERAADDGLLSKIGSQSVAMNIDKGLRSKADQWVAASVRTRVIFYNTDTMNPKLLSTYENLADPKFAGKLCLRTSKKVYNTALVGAMIRNDGEGAVTNTVRGWVKNLAAPVFGDDTLMIDAVAKGQCGVAIANAHYYFRYMEKNPTAKVGIFYPNQKTYGSHVNLTGLGIIDGSKNAVEARQFIEFITGTEGQKIYAEANFEFPANARVKAVAPYGAFKRDAFLIERSGYYQSRAAKVMVGNGYL